MSTWRFGSWVSRWCPWSACTSCTVFSLDNANFLKVQAETARTNKKVEEAVKQYNQYLKYRDDPEGYAALAELVVGVAGDADATRQQKWRTYTILEEAIRRHPDLTAVHAN